MSKQSIDQLAFNIIHARALNPIRSANKNTGFCMYRSDNGTCCFVGSLIKDEYYNTNLESNTALDVRVQKAVELSLNGNPDPFFLRRAQHIHDTIKPENWLKELEKLAKEYSLTVPTI